MEPSEPRIEVFAPFGEAFETTRKILFQPFDLTKWFVIGFAAWLATMFSGGGFNYRRGFGNGDWDWKAHTHGAHFRFTTSRPGSFRSPSAAVSRPRNRRPSPLAQLARPLHVH